MINKFLVTLISIVIAMFAICKLNTKSNTIENYLNFPLTVKRVVDVVDNKGNATTTMNNLQFGTETKGNSLGSAQVANSLQFFKPTYPQQTISPRFQTGLRGTMKQNLNDNYLAIPGKNGNGQIKEGYGGCGSGECDGFYPSCNKDGVGNGIPTGAGPEVSSNYVSPTYKTAWDGIYGDKINQNQSELPVGTMQSVNASGSEGPSDTVVIERFMTTTKRRGRGFAQGDPIRGDLAILPCGPAWFRPSSDPSRDLRTGAMAVMGGIQNDTATELASLQTQYMGDLSYGNIGLSGSGNPLSASAIQSINNSNTNTMAALNTVNGLQAMNMNGGSDGSGVSPYASRGLFTNF